MVLSRLLLTTLVVTSMGCGAAAKEPKLEDEARTLTPVPACVVRLPSRSSKTAGTMRGLKQEQYWQVIFPGYDVAKKNIPDNATTCTGRPIFNDPLFEGTTRLRAWPDVQITDEDILMGSGGDRLKVVWMRTHTTKDGLLAGPIALVRAKESVAEIYAIGAYAAATKRPYFMVERMGNEPLVTIADEGCGGVRPGIRCENRTSIFVPRKGRLAPLGVFATERRDFAEGYEQGAPGPIEYRMTSSLSYTPTGVKVFEQVVARDPEGRELRKAEVERVFAFREIELRTDEDSLWPRVYPRHGQ